ENKSWLPRAIAVPASGIEVIHDPHAQLARLKDTSFDPERSVVFADRPAIRPDESSTGVATRDREEVLQQGINDIRLTTTVQAPSVIVLSQMYYPGWQASVDGVDVPVYPVNLALTGIVVPSSAKEILLSFRPWTFRAGAVISLLSLAAVGLGLFLRR